MCRTEPLMLSPSGCTVVGDCDRGLTLLVPLCMTGEYEPCRAAPCNNDEFARLPTAHVAWRCSCGLARSVGECGGTNTRRAALVIKSWWSTVDEQ